MLRSGLHRLPELHVVSMARASRTTRRLQLAKREPRRCNPLITAPFERQDIGCFAIARAFGPREQEVSRFTSTLVHSLNTWTANARRTHVHRGRPYAAAHSHAWGRQMIEPD
jgi:hypothetical protein